MSPDLSFCFKPWPASLNFCPECVSLGIFKLISPSNRGINTLPPKTASYGDIGTLYIMSRPSIFILSVDSIFTFILIS